MSSLNMAKRMLVLLAAATGMLGVSAAITLGQVKAPASQPADTTLVPFESEADVKNWSALHDPAAKAQDPDAKVEWSKEGAFPGAPSMKITFDGGQWPAVTTSVVAVADWTPFNAVKVEVATSRPCVVGFRAYSDKAAAADINAHWEKTVFLQAGRNSLVIPVGFGVKFTGKQIGAMDIYMYSPHPGESLQVANVRLAKVKAAPGATTEFAVLGTDLKVKGPLELAAKLKEKLPTTQPATVDEVEAAFKSRYDELKKTHPKAVLAILRDGEKGSDAANPAKVYEGWKDTMVFTHPPDANHREQSLNHGREATLFCYARNTNFRMMQVDLSVIPNSSAILAAELMLVRKPTGAKEDRDSQYGGLAPTLRVFEACNRDWEETEINAFQYAKDKAWKELAGADWTGDDPDFLPLYVAYGYTQGAGIVHTWDFSEAVKYWTAGTHPNHGYSMFCQYHEPDRWWASPSRRAANVKDRPALMVIYEPQEGAK